MTKYLIAIVAAASLGLGGCSRTSHVEKTSQEFNALPPAVQKAVRAQAPKAQASNATIKNIRRHDENGRLIYEFEFEDQGKNPTMRVAEDGTVVQTLKK